MNNTFLEIHPRQNLIVLNGEKIEIDLPTLEETIVFIKEDGDKVLIERDPFKGQEVLKKTQAKPYKNLFKQVRAKKAQMQEQQQAKETQEHEESMEE